MSEPTLFVPFTGKHGLAPVQRETRLIRDYTMPVRDWERYYVPTYQRQAWWKPKKTEAA